jgi:hypothetical protein
MAWTGKTSPCETSLMCIWTFSIVTEYTNTTFQKQTEHLKAKAVCFWKVVFVYSATMEKVQIHISDVSHVTPLSKNCSVQSNFYLHAQNLKQCESKKLKQISGEIAPPNWTPVIAYFLILQCRRNTTNFFSLYRQCTTLTTLSLN